MFACSSATRHDRSIVHADAADALPQIPAIYAIRNDSVTYVCICVLRFAIILRESRFWWTRRSNIMICCLDWRFTIRIRFANDWITGQIVMERRLGVWDCVGWFCATGCPITMRKCERVCIWKHIDDCSSVFRQMTKMIRQTPFLKAFFVCDL